MTSISRRIGPALLVMTLVWLSSAWTGASSASGDNSAFSRTEKITRDHLVDGSDQIVDTRTVTVSVSETRDLRDRQAIEVRWKGAHPTGGLVPDQNSAAAALQEYPVVVMQCRGVDSSSVPARQRVRPQTCWTQTPNERFQYSQSGTAYPPYRMDRYADSVDRAETVGEPSPLPAACSHLEAAHWIPFLAEDGTVYPGGNLGCGGLAPEAANSADSLQPGNTTYGVADLHGNGGTKFVIQNADSNASMGCSPTVRCTLEVIPIEGLSCDAAGAASGGGLGMPAGTQPPPSLVPLLYKQCSVTGQFAPGEYNGSGSAPDLPVSGALWWAASNWRNRVSVPLTFAPSANVCDVVTDGQTAYLYGSEALVQATQQWAPSFCLNPKLFSLRHVQTSEPQAKNLLNIGNVEAAVEGGPPQTPFVNPTVQAPTAVTGFAIAYSVDGVDGHTLPTLNLDARLLAKLLSESYRSCPDCLPDFDAIADNPIDISRDPEFKALNPDAPDTVQYLQPAAALAFMSSDSDVMTALTSYINSDPEARAWLDGQPDPWGMVVNPAYKKIKLPVANWPLLDTHIAQLSVGANLCLSADPVPWLPLVASPVSNPATIALNMQFDIANSQIKCNNNGQANQKLTAVGREIAGQRYLFGLVSLADARRYQLNVAALQTQRTSSGTAPFTDASGRTFVAPTNAALSAAAKLLHADADAQTWTVPYDTLRTSAAGKEAYPGTMLMSIDVPTTGLSKADASNYAELLRFVAGAGQTQGLGNGELPPGYLPMTAANGLAAEVAYTDRAADAVAAQAGQKWPLAAQPPTHSRSPSHSPSSSRSPSSPHRTPGGGSTVVPPPGNVGAGSTTGPPEPSPSSSASASAPASPRASSPSQSPRPSATSTPSAQPQAAARTSDVKPGLLSLGLPVLALLALVALGAAGWISGVGRR